MDGGDSRRVPRTGVQPVRILLSLPKKSSDRLVGAFFYPRRSRSLLGRARQGANQSARMRGTRVCGHGPQTISAHSAAQLGFAPGGRRRFFPKGKCSQPPILFSREKRTGRWSGPRENAPGGMKLTAPPEDEMPPWTPTKLGEGGAFTQPKSPRSRRRGLRGNMVPPSNRARPAVRCRTALPQKRRDFGGADRSSAWKAESFVLRPVAASSRPRPVGGIPARCGNPPSPPAAEISRPRPWAESPFPGKRNRGRQSLRRLRRQLPLHKGAIFGAASPQGGNPAVRRMFKRLERFLRGAPSGRKEQARPAGKEVLCNMLM